MTQTLRSILLAEDDPAVLKMTKLRLEHEGFRVLTATDGQQALDCLKHRGAVDLILLDVRMPKLNGFQVCKRLKADPQTARIPIVVFTASSSNWQHIMDQCLELGIADWLKKPFRSEELLGKIHHALGDQRGEGDG